jgi:hypothetical protein
MERTVAYPSPEDTTVSFLESLEAFVTPEVGVVAEEDEVFAKFIGSVFGYARSSDFSRHQT